MTTVAIKSSAKPEGTSHEGTDTDHETTNTKHSTAPDTTTADKDEDESTSNTNADKDKDDKDNVKDEETKDKESTGDKDTSPPEIDYVEKPDLTKPDLPPAPDMRKKPKVGSAEETGQVTNLLGLSVEDIRGILDINNLFKGIKLRGEQSPESTQYLVDPAKTKFNWSSLHEATVVATTVFSERTARLVEQGWTKTVANFSSPWVSGGIEVSKNETHASQSTKRYLYTTSSYVLKKMKVTIDKEVAAKNLTKGFLDDVRNTVNESVVEKRLERLREVFKKYGHVFLTSVIIGTSMVTSLKQEQTSKATVDTIEKSLKAKVAAKYGAFSGGVSHGSGSTTERGSTSDDQNSTLTFTAKGGNTAFSTNARKWLESTGDHTLWTVIATEEVVPLTDLIFLHDKKLGQQVNECVPRPLIGKFIREDTRENTWGVQRPKEEWLNQGWYWLGSSTEHDHLLVREAEEGALGLIEKTKTLQTWERIWFVEPTVCAPVPTHHEDYVILGHIHGYSSSVPNGLRAVRKDLVVSAVPRGTSSPLIRSEGVLDMCWSVEPNLLRHEEPALNGTSYFYYVKPEKGSMSTTRDMALKQGSMYLLKESAILMTNTIDDAKKEYEESQ